MLQNAIPHPFLHLFGPCPSLLNRCCCSSAAVLCLSTPQQKLVWLIHLLQVQAQVVWPGTSTTSTTQALEMAAEPAALAQALALTRAMDLAPTLALELATLPPM